MLKKHLVAAALAVTSGGALAADPPRLAPPPPIPPLFTWTGAYVGVSVGVAATEDRNIRTFGNNGIGAGALIGPVNTNTVANVLADRRPASVTTGTDSFTVGGHLGYNFQFNPGSGFVLGGETDVQYVDLTRGHTFTSSLGDVSNFRQGIDVLATVRGRVGYAIDNILLYGTGGYAFGQVNQQALFYGNATGRPLAYAGGYSGFGQGFAYGGGVELALPPGNFLNVLGSNAITIRGEYLRYDLGSRDVLVGSVDPATNRTRTAATGSYTSRFSTEGNLIRASLSYKFGL